MYMKGVGLNRGDKHTMYCNVCGKPFDYRDLKAVMFHDTKCEPEDGIILTDEAGYIRLEDEMLSYLPRFEFVRHAEPFTMEQVLDLIRKVTSSL